MEHEEAKIVSSIFSSDFDVVHQTLKKRLSSVVQFGGDNLLKKSMLEKFMI